MRLFEKRTKFSDNDASERITDEMLFRTMIISVFGIAICVMCLVGLTWAWFTATADSSGEIKAANFLLTVEVKDGENSLESDENGIYTIEPSKTYNVTLRVDTNTTKGFCLIEATPLGMDAATPYKTCNFNTTNTTCTFSVSGFQHIKFSSKWGEISATDESNIIENNGTLNYSPPEPTTASSPAEAPKSNEEPPAEIIEETPPTEENNKTDEETPVEEKSETEK